MPDVFVMKGRPEDEIFTFEDRSVAPHKCWHFNVSMAWRWITAHSPDELRAAGVILTRQPLPRDWIENVLLPMGTHEEARVAQLDEERLRVPLLGIMWDDGTTVLMDGNHRMIRKYRDNDPTYGLVLFPLSMREMFRIDLPGRGTLDIDVDRIPKGPMGEWLKSRGVV